MADIKYFTKEALEKLQKELHRLITVERPGISSQIAEARDKGDLSENAEYDAAKEAQGLLEMKIAKLQDEISKSRIIDNIKIDTSKVYLYSTVTVLNLKTKGQHIFSLVNESEADLKTGKISIDSPISKGLLGSEVGDEVEITVPAGKLHFKVVDIKY